MQHLACRSRTRAAARDNRSAFCAPWKGVDARATNNCRSGVPARPGRFKGRRPEEEGRSANMQADARVNASLGTHDAEVAQRKAADGENDERAGPFRRGSAEDEGGSGTASPAGDAHKSTRTPRGAGRALRDPTGAELLAASSFALDEFPVARTPSLRAAEAVRDLASLRRSLRLGQRHGDGERPSSSACGSFGAIPTVRHVDDRRAARSERRSDRVAFPIAEAACSAAAGTDARAVNRCRAARRKPLSLQERVENVPKQDRPYMDRSSVTDILTAWGRLSDFTELDSSS